jgi:hypothetical protein
LSRDGGGGNAWTAMRRGGAARFFHRESLGLGDGRGGAVWTQEVGSGHPVERQRIVGWIRDFGLPNDRNI